jgi:hypothetical protein
MDINVSLLLSACDILPDVKVKRIDQMQDAIIIQYVARLYPIASQCQPLACLYTGIDVFDPCPHRAALCIYQERTGIADGGTHR